MTGGNQVRRYSITPFPAYRYVPGKFPHPTRDPQGHSFNKHSLQYGPIDLSHWQQCEPYLYGVDLFNHGYWWEAHEAWESCWIAAGKATETGLFIQGLIQIAAACLKKYQGFDDAATRLLNDGLEKFPAAVPLPLGIETARFSHDLRNYLAGVQTAPPSIHLQGFEN